MPKFVFSGDMLIVLSQLLIVILFLNFVKLLVIFNKNPSACLATEKEFIFFGSFLTFIFFYKHLNQGYLMKFQI